MGLLDDAIREHLELKRRHGADPQEVARQEDEVLGVPGEDESHPEHEDEHEHEAQEPHVHEHQQELELPPEPVQEVHQPTVEYSVEDEHAAEEPPAEEPAEPADELEETPEFLQETPEHDRLWFEQKPPRDFDF